VRGIVTGAEGRPLEGARVSSSPAGSAITDKDGAFALAALPGPAGTILAISAEAEGYEPAIQRNVAPDVTIAFTLTRMVSVEVEITNLREKMDLTVAFLRTDSRQSSPREIKITDSGTLPISLSPGAYQSRVKLGMVSLLTRSVSILDQHGQKVAFDLSQVD